MNDSFPKTYLESLWAPWRVEYFQAEHQTGSISSAKPPRPTTTPPILSSPAAKLPFFHEQIPIFGRSSHGSALPQSLRNDGLTDEEVTGFGISSFMLSAC